jgi:hypothetical protein
VRGAVAINAVAKSAAAVRVGFERIDMSDASRGEVGEISALYVTPFVETPLRGPP